MESHAKAEIGKDKDEGRVLCSMPGRFGDILWALPTVRAISEYHGKPVSFVTSLKYGSIIDLVRAQDYIDLAFVDHSWTVLESAPITPREPVTRYDGYEWQYHLGYRGWPTDTLPGYIWRMMAESSSFSLSGLDGQVRLWDPWIKPSTMKRVATRIAVGFSPEWIELKMGVLLNLAAEFDGVKFDLLVPDKIGSRIREWTNVLPPNVMILPCSWTAAAHHIATSGLFLGCLSGLWVLANAVGTPTVIFEPSPERHHPIFWVDIPGWKNQNHLVKGVDGKPTFDARHIINDVDDALLAGKEVADGKTAEPDDR